MNDEQDLNPSVMEVKIGIRKLHPITIYPLSIPDQKKLSGSITGALQSFFAKSEDNPEMSLDNVVFVDFIIDTILENLTELIRLVTDFPKKRDAEGLLADMTNPQAVDIAMAVYTQNYETALKNASSLFDQVRSLFQSPRPLPQSVPNTDI
ncbi:unnamed protein product, partial [marine sediment metagenome]